MPNDIKAYPIVSYKIVYLYTLAYISTVYTNASKLRVNILLLAC
jgi:hypothetical protein